MGVFGNGTKIDEAYDVAIAWKKKAQDLEAKYQRLSDKHVRLSSKYETMNIIVGRLNDGPSVKAIANIHQLKVKQMQFIADEKRWDTKTRRAANIKLMAEAEYDYHVVADPVYRLHNASEALMKIADYSDNNQSEKIMAIVAKMKNTGGAREDAHREKFLATRIKELTGTLRYENTWDATPIVDSIPPAMQRDRVSESGDGWKIIANKERTEDLLIQNQNL